MTTRNAADSYRSFQAQLASCGTELDPLDFYRSVFPSGSLERHRPELEGLSREDRLKLYRGLPDAERRPNGLVLEVPPRGSGHGARQWTVTDDLKALERFTRDESVFALMAPVGYSGSRRDLAHAYTLFAMAFDVDEPKLDGLLHQASHRIIPCPTFIILSGHGVHLYYQFESPLPMYPRNAAALNLLKRYLTRRIWNPYTSHIDKPQYQSINQGFRIVGGRSKLGKGYPVRAYRYGPPVTIGELIGFLPDEEQADVGNVIELTDKHVSLEQARELWPEWYHRRIEKGETAKSWHIKRDLYDWWLKKIQYASSVGHRYFCIMALAVYAMKCDVPREELERDAYGLIPLFDSISPADNPFTREDVKAALKAYADKYATFTRDAIVFLTGIPMPPNRRNYRKQDLHLRIARATRDAIHPDDTWREGNGRPIGMVEDKRRLVLDYASSHSDAGPTEIARETGVSRSSVYKYLPDVERKPRGISSGRPDKQQLVLDWLEAHDDHSVDAVMAGCGVSRPTAAKYLELWNDGKNKTSWLEIAMSQILKQHGMDVKAQDSLGNGAREAAKLRMQELIAHMSDGFMDSKKDETDLDRHMEQGKG